LSYERIYMHKFMQLLTNNRTNLAKNQF